MKIHKILTILAAAGLVAWATGCDKKEATVQDGVKSVTDAAGDAVKKTTEAVQETGTKIGTDVADKAKEVAAPASSKAQELIDSAKSLVSAGKFQDALAKLKALGTEKLSPTQQSMVDALKAQIQKALGATPPTAADAAGSAGSMLKQ
jgi:hypothetical protein